MTRIAIAATLLALAGLAHPVALDCPKGLPKGTRT
jgi:hypothetical protein